MRVLVQAAAWFSYGALLSNLNALDDGSRMAEIIWGACTVGFAITAATDLVKPALFGSMEELLTYRTALRSGILPAGIDITVWERRQ